jgi:RNA polymerase sigma factor (sigma-70 family)
VALRGDGGVGSGIADTLDPVGQVQQFPVGVGVEVGPAGTFAQNQLAGRQLAAPLGVNLIPPPVDIQRRLGPHEFAGANAAGHNGAMSEVSHILAQIDSGDPCAAEQLLPLIYDELRKLAAAKLAHEKPGQTLQATALVHEAYLRLVGESGQKSEVGSQKPEGTPASPTSDLRPLPSSSDLRSLTSAPAFRSRGHFFAAAAEAMRRILIENARHKASLKRGGDKQRLPLDTVASGGRERASGGRQQASGGREPPEFADGASDATDPDDLLALDESLARLSAADPQAAEIVKLRYFAGLTMDQAAQALGVSPRTAYYAWEYARSWLRQDLRGS